jgi:hypothetical protein
MADEYLDWLVKPGHAGVDLHELRRHHQRTVRALRAERKLRREAERECDHLRRVVVEVAVKWYSDPSPGMVDLSFLGGGGSLDSALHDALQYAEGERENPADG